MAPKKKPTNRMKRRGYTPREFNSQAWINHHKHLFAESLRDVVRRPFSNALTWLVIAVALALPTLLFVTQKNLQQLAGQWQEGAQVSLFLYDTVSPRDGALLAEDVRQRPEVRDAWYLSKHQALTEFSAWLDLGGVIDALDSNPLPATIVVLPISQTRTDIEILGTVLSSLPEVADLQLDIEWVQRLENINAFLHRVMWAVSSVLGLTVLLIVGNTMRMATEARRDEIMVVKLVGATSSFVRRPFLYMGLWYGCFGGVMACIMVWTSLALLQAPVAALAESYASNMRLQGLTILESLLLMVIAVGLSILSTWVTVSRRLARIEPNPVL